MRRRGPPTVIQNVCRSFLIFGAFAYPLAPAPTSPASGPGHLHIYCACVRRTFVHVRYLRFMGGICKLYYGVPSISVFCYPKVLLGLVMKFQGECGGADVRECGSGGAMMRDAHALMHPNARDGPLSASRAGSYVRAILPKISTHHPSAEASGVVSCLSLGLLNTQCTQFSLVSLV
jgi:hypothetical protein